MTIDMNKIVSNRLTAYIVIFKGEKARKSLLSVVLTLCLVFVVAVFVATESSKMPSIISWSTKSSHLPGCQLARHR